MDDHGGYIQTLPPSLAVDVRASADSVRARTEDRSSRVRWLARRWRPLAALALAVPIGLLATIRTLDWPGRPFPGFFVLCNNVVPTIGLYSWTGLEAGVPFHARIIDADGHAVRSSADVYEHAASLPVGTGVTYTFVKGEETFTRTVSTMQFGVRDYWLTIGMFVLNGFMMVGLSVLISFLRPHRRDTRAFLILGSVTGLFAFTATALYHPDLGWLSPLHLVMHAFLPATFIHFGLAFPAERSFIRRRPLWLLVPYLVSAVLAVWVLSSFYASPPSMTALYAIYRYTSLAIAVLIGLVAFAYGENRTPTVRARLGAMLLGIILAAGLALVGFLNIAGHGGDFPINLIAVPAVLFCPILAYGVVNHDLFDIDALIKQAVVSLMLTLGITAAYVASVVLLGTLLPPQVVQASPIFNVAFVVLVAFLFQPLRTSVQYAIDRAFYRNRLDYRRTVVEVSAVLTSVLDLEEILDRVGPTLTDGLQLRSLAVVLWLDGSTQIWRYSAPTSRMVEGVGPSCTALHDELARAPRRPLHLAELEAAVADGADQATTRDLAAARGEMATLDAIMLVPLALADTVIGAFALGTKRSDRYFSNDDLELLGTLAAESAIAIQNARSYRALKTLNEVLEARIQARTAELSNSNVELAGAYENLQAAQTQLITTEKMASLGLVVAGVAHEINNPLSLIVGNVEPLQRTLADLTTLAERHQDAGLKALVDRFTKILSLMMLGAERTAGIVRDLRAFSSPNEIAPQFVDLHECLEVTLRLLRPLWGDRVVLHREYGRLPRIEVVAGQMNQVLMNILANACDAIRGDGNIWISTRTAGSWIEVVIRDDGSGISAADLPRIFDPFFTTKSMGKGTGLGLAISRGLVTHHGGTIEVASEVGRGSELRIVLPLRQSDAGFR